MNRNGGSGRMGGGGHDMELEVMCYAGFKGDERPVRFRLGGVEYLVEEILRQWYEPEDQFFKVRASDGKVLVLRRCGAPAEGVWRLEEGLAERGDGQEAPED